jgi:transposase
MAYREITMIEIKEVLRRWVSGIPKKRLAAQLGLDPKTGSQALAGCKVVGLTERTVQRWAAQGGGDDLRRGPRSPPSNKLSAAEEQRVLDVANSLEFHDVSPRQIVPILTDRDAYLASESAFYRILGKHGLLHHRARSRPPTRRPRALTATGPDQVYSWDITYLRSRVRGVYYYLYLVVDIWSRRIAAAGGEDVEVTAEVSVVGRHEVDRAMQVLGVVPLDEARDPGDRRRRRAPSWRRGCAESPPRPATTGPGRDSRGGGRRGVGSGARASQRRG